MDGKVVKFLKERTVRNLLANIHNDLEEDGDSGFHMDINLYEYIEQLASYENEK